MKDMKDPKDPRVFCLTLFEQERYLHIRTELLMCPESFETNKLATEVINDRVDNTGGQILRCRYWKNVKGAYCYSCTPIKKIRDLEPEGLLAIFVLSELNRTTQDIAWYLDQLVPMRHHKDHLEFSRCLTETWPAHAFVDLAAFNTPDEPCFAPLFRTYHKEREIEAEVYRMSIRVYNIRSPVSEKEWILVPLAPCTHIASTKPPNWTPSESIISIEVQATLLQNWEYGEKPPMVPIYATAHAGAIWVFDFRSRTFGELANDPNTSILNTTRST